MTSQTAPKKKETGRAYLLLLPGQAEPQQLVLMSGLTGWGLKVQLVEKVEALKKVTAATLRLFIGAREIPDSELVHKTIPLEQVITVEVKSQ